jgi:hypothetical protein
MKSHHAALHFEIEDPLKFFSAYMRLTGVPHLGPEKRGDPRLLGKRLGLLNGSSWITLWCNYFGRLFLPGVHLVNAGNEAVQLNFMQAYAAGEACPPKSNIDRFAQYARDLAELAHVQAVLITCSTMNRSFPVVAEALAPYRIPVVQIDQPLMEAAIEHGGEILVIATHGPTVANTQALLEETAQRLGRTITYDGLALEAAWEKLGEGDVHGHNEALAEAIRSATRRKSYSCIVLAQLSMTAFLLSYPDPVTTFGLPVLTSGQCGFEQMREVLLALS